MKKFAWVGLAFALFVIPSHAQQYSAADVAAGYSYLHVGGVDGSTGTNMNGGSGNVGLNVSNWLGLVADVGVYHASPAGVGLTTSTYTFGPRVSYRSTSRVVPFGQFLLGGAHFAASYAGASATSNPFAYSFGGGADFPISNSGRVSLRPEVDYVGFHENGTTENSVRISAGIVFHLGGR